MKLYDVFFITKVAKPGTNQSERFSHRCDAVVRKLRGKNEFKVMSNWGESFSDPNNETMTVNALTESEAIRKYFEQRIGGYTVIEDFSAGEIEL